MAWNKIDSKKITLAKYLANGTLYRAQKSHKASVLQNLITNYLKNLINVAGVPLFKKTDWLNGLVFFYKINTSGIEMKVKKSCWNAILK